MFYEKFVMLQKFTKIIKLDQWRHYFSVILARPGCELWYVNCNLLTAFGDLNLDFFLFNKNSYFFLKREV